MTDSFESLPDKAPYGFLIYPTGEFEIVSAWGKHDDSAAKFGYKNANDVLSAGGIRVYDIPHTPGDFPVEYSKSKVKRSAKKTAHDLAEWYNLTIIFTGNSDLNETRSTMKKKSRTSTFKLREFFPELANKNDVSEIALGLGGGYGGAPGGPVVGSWGAAPVSPGFSDARSGMFKSQNYANPATGSNGAVTMAQLIQGQNYPNMPYGDMRNGAKYTPATKPVDCGGNNIPPTQHVDQSNTNQHGNSYMNGNTVISNGLVDIISPEDLSDPRFDSDELRSGIRQELQKMEYPLKTVALMKAKENLAKNKKYYSDLGQYDIGIK